MLCLRACFAIVLGLFVCAVSGKGPNLNDLQQEYEQYIFGSNNYTGYEYCIYGLLCARADEYCSPVSESCEPAFAAEDFKNDDEKATYCADLGKNFKDKSIISFKKDACVYFLGRRSIENPPVSVGESKESDISVGYEICIYDGSLCHRASQYCSPSTKTCEQVFGKDEFTSEQDKEQKCRELVRDVNTESWKKDACFYILGQSVVMNGSQEEDRIPYYHIIVLYVLVGALFVLVVGLMVGYVVLKRRTTPKKQRDEEQGGNGGADPPNNNGDGPQPLAQRRNLNQPPRPAGNSVDNDISGTRGGREMAENERNNALAHDQDRRPNVTNLRANANNHPCRQQGNGQRDAAAGVDEPSGQHGHGGLDAERVPNRQEGGGNAGAQGDTRPSEQADALNNNGNRAPPLAHGRDVNIELQPLVNNLDNDINGPSGGREMAENERNNALAHDQDRLTNVNNAGGNANNHPRRQQGNGQRDAAAGVDEPSGQHGHGELDAERVPNRQEEGDIAGAQGDTRPNGEDRPAVNGEPQDDEEHSEDGNDEAAPLIGQDPVVQNYQEALPSRD